MESKDIDTLQIEISKAEDILMRFAEKKEIRNFIDKWGTKSYSDSDHTIDNMVEDLLAYLSGDYQEYFLY